MKPDVEGIRAPDFPAMEWLNTEPLTRSSIQGKTLLVEFWDYTCLESLENVSLLSQWHRLYRDHGLVLAGVHTPEFPFAAQKINLERAVSQLGIGYPVALDADHEAWKAFHNRQWPARYLFDSSGTLSYYHYGSGDDAGCEEAFRGCILALDSKKTLPEARTDPDDKPDETPEPEQWIRKVHLGLEQGRIGNHEEGATGEFETFTLPGRREEERPYLDGKWHAQLHCVASASTEPSALSFRYTGTDAYVTLECAEEIDLEITLDDRPLPSHLCGSDVRVSETGTTWLSVHHPRNYHLISSHENATRDLRMQSEATGLRAYAIRIVGRTESGGNETK